MFLLSASFAFSQCASYAGPDQTVCEHELPLSLFTPADTYWTGPDITSTGSFNPSTGGVYNLVLVTDSPDCQDSDEVIITVLNAPTVNAGADDQVCEFTEFQINAVASSDNGPIVVWSWSGDDEYLSSTNIPNPVAYPIGSSSFNLTVADSEGCFSFDQINLTASELPTVDAGEDLTTCDNPSPVDLEGFPVGGTWSGPGVTNNQFISPGEGTHTLEYEYSTPQGCTNTDQLSITVTAPPNVDAGSPLELCENEGEVELSDHSPSGGTWTGAGVSASGTFDPTGLTGSQTLTYTVGYGVCAVQDSRLITVNAAPLVTADSEYNFCHNASSANLNNALPLGGNWIGLLVEESNSGSISTSSVESNSSVMYVYEDSFGCSDTAHAEVFIREIPEPIFTIESQACNFNELEITNSSSADLDCSWLISLEEESTDADPTITLINEGTYSVKLSVTSEFGCENTSAAQQVEVIAAPVAEFSTDALEGCEPFEVNFDNQSSGEYLTFDWDFGVSSSSSSQPGSVNFGDVSEDTNHTISLEVTNLCGTSSASQIITSKALPTADFNTQISTQCSPVYAEFINTSSENSTDFFWDFGDGDTSDSPNPDLKVFTTDNASETFDIVLTVANECGVNSLSQDLTVLPNPVQAGFSTSQLEFCSPAQINFSNASNGATSITYDFDGVLINDFNTIQNYTTSGEYEVFQYATDGCGFDTTSVTLTIHPEPAASITMSEEAVCSGLPITFSSEGETLENHQWVFGTAGTSSASNPSVNFSEFGLETIQLTAYTELNNCLVELSETVEVFPLPNINYTLSAETGCSPFLLEIENNSTDASIFNWNLNLFSSNSPEPEFNLTTPGAYNLSVTALNEFGCEASESENAVFVLNDTPLADFTFNPFEAHILTNPDVSFQSFTEGADSILWDFGDGAESIESSPVHTYESAGTYLVSLTAVTNEGCSDKMWQDIFVKDELTVFIPNSFSPNADGLNDVFTPRVAGSNFTNYHFYVFDRWGNVVFKSDEPNVGWEGDVSGGDHYVSNGVYTWRVDVLLNNGEGNQVFTGEVNVFR